MNRFKMLLSMLIVVFIAQSCAPVLVGGLIWKSRKSKQEKNEFLRDLRAINLEREKAGLAPLDKCIEMYHFDPGWANETADCRGKIDSLNMAGIKQDTARVIGAEEKDSTDNNQMNQ